MKKITILLLLLCSVNFVFSQQTKQIVKVGNTSEIIDKGAELFEAGDYMAALKEFSKVPEGDPEYNNAQYDIAYVQTQMEDYSGALQTLTKLLTNPLNAPSVNHGYMLLAGVYEELEQYDKALEIYQLLLERMPYNANLRCYTANCLFQFDRYEEAYEHAKMAVLISPASRKAHFFYGLANMFLGYTVPGVLAFNYAVLLDNGNIRPLGYLESLYDQGIYVFNQDNKIDVSDKYEEMNEFYAPLMKQIETKDYFQKQFKSLSSIDLELVKANQLIMQNVLVRPNSYTIEDQLYVPFFKSVLRNNMYDVMSYYQLAETDVNDGKVAKKAAKMTKKFQNLITMLVQHLDEVAARGLGIENNGDTTYIYERLNLVRWGAVLHQEDGNMVENGIWKRLENNAVSEVLHYKMGALDGLAEVYENGQLLYKVNYRDGEPNGVITAYYVDPYCHTRQLSDSTVLVDGKRNGPSFKYSFSGNLTQEANVIDGKKFGPAKEYNNQGILMKEAEYLEDEVVGEEKFYYENGKLESVNKYTPAGVNYVSYYVSGVKKREFLLRNDSVVGPYLAYYPDGKLKNRTFYNDKGQADGSEYRYYRSGVPSVYREWKNGEMLFEQAYRRNGKPNFRADYQDGKLISVTTYNPDSSVRETSVMKDHHVSYKFYSENGILQYEATVDENSDFDGVKTIYYPSGQIHETASFQKGLMQGVCQDYYGNGRLRSYAEFDGGKPDGLVVHYADNAANSVQTEGVYKQDVPVGMHYEYYEDGNLKTKTQYDEEGTVQSVTEYFPDGIIKAESFYYKGNDFLARFYNRNGEIIAADTLRAASGTIAVRNANGAVYATREVVNGELHGLQILYDLQGNPNDTTRYISGLLDGKQVLRYAINPAVKASECDYVLGVIQGKYVSYAIDGSKDFELMCEDGVAQGMGKYYDLNGNPSFEIFYDAGVAEGIATSYATDGKTVVQERLFENDECIAVSCRQADGTMSDFVKMKGEQQFKCYYSANQVSMVYNTNNGQKEGMYARYYPDGKAYTTINYKAGLKDGSSLVYYPDGKIHEESEYKDGLKHGAYKFYYDNGQLQFEGNYYYDLPHGEFKAYSRDGKLLRKVTVLYSEVMSEEVVNQ